MRTLRAKAGPARQWSCSAPILWRVGWQIDKNHKSRRIYGAPKAVRAECVTMQRAGGPMDRRWMRFSLAGSVIAVLTGVIGHGQAVAPAARQPVTKAQGERWMTELSNWGRW